MNRNKNKRASDITNMDIAVIGMAGRFPGANDVVQFRENLEKGVEAISFFSDDELQASGIVADIITNPGYIKAYGYMEDIEYFDSGFFAYSPKEAEVMNPQTRIFHECVWKALEDAGYVAKQYDGQIGLYAGASTSFEWEALTILGDRGRGLDHMGIANLSNKDSLCTRVAYKLGLHGPAVSISTACSTSLLAIHQACRAILTGECKMALAGGISIAVNQKQGYIYQEGMIASPDGHCRAFDKKAGGTVGGSGVGVVVLKLLRQALEDGDFVYAVIKGSAANNDGIRKVGYTAPSVEGQVEVIRKALRMARLKPEDIGYVETHGTGTMLGDPVEIEALKLVFDTAGKNFCGLGSVKSNVGHLDAAAGVTGFIKTVLALKHRLIPPTLHFETPNPRIDIENSPFYVNTKLTEWKGNGQPLRAGVSSFGIGGTNAHVVLEEAPGSMNDHVHSKPPRSRETRGRYKLILLSAKTKAALNKIAENLKDFLGREPHTDLSDIAHMLQVGRRAFRYRRMVVCSTSEQLGAVLSSMSSKSSPGNPQTFFTKEDFKRPVIFMFPGQGSQYIGMGARLYRGEPLFRREFDGCLDIMESAMGIDAEVFRDAVRERGPFENGDTAYPTYGAQETMSGSDSKDMPGTKEEDFINRGEGTNGCLNQTVNAQPAIFAFEYALARLVMTWGIRPDAMIGHSIGEYTAACLAGVFELEDALKLVVARGQLMQETAPGAMLSVALSPEEITPFLDDEISLAAVNAPSQCVVSGPFEAVDKIEKKLQEKGCDCKRLVTSHAFHSKLMDPILKEFEKKVANITLHPPRIPYLSNVTGQKIRVGDAVDPAYWARHIRGTVQFAAGLRELSGENDAVFIEVGPGGALSSLARRQMDKEKGQLVINLVPPPKDNTPGDYYFLDKIGKLWLHGIKIDWQSFYSEKEKGHRIPLPTYPFDRMFYPLEVDIFRIGTNPAAGTRKLQRKSDISQWFYIPSWKRVDRISPRNGKTTTALNHLMFCGEHDPGIELARQLRQQGHDVTIVKIGDRFARESTGVYTINSREKNDYHALLTELQELTKIPARIVHLWNVQENRKRPVTIASFTNTQETGFYSLLYLVQALEKQKIIDNIKIMIVTTNLQNVNGQEMLHPEQATLVGLARVIPQEYAHINCRLVDIDLPRTNSKPDKKLIGQLLGEIDSDTPGLTIAYRRNVRWVQCFEPINLAAAARPFDLLKKKGVYLITGGLGNIGMILSAYLAKTCQGRLVLTGRSEFPLREQWGHYLASPGEQESIKQKIRVLQAGEAAGAEIMVCQADTADYSQMKQVISRTEERFGAIDGVIHAAGITRGRSITSLDILDKTICDKQFVPKAAGLVVLEKVTRNKKLDFCLVTSSLASVLGGLGYGAYAAANSFMDAFTQYHNRESDSRWICVNWDGWQLHEEPLSSNTGSAAKDQPGMLPHEGIEAFKRILSNEGIDCVVTSTGDLQTRLDRWINRETLQDEKEAASPGETVSVYPRPDISIPFVEPRNRLEEMIAGVWQKYFAIEKVGVHDDFFELGGDSLMGIKFVTSYKEMLGEIVHVRVLFDAPTIAELADYFNEHYPETVARLMNSAVNPDDKPRSGRIDREIVDTIRWQMPTAVLSTNEGGGKNPRAVFILCAPRTGSTLLRVIIGGHPQLFAPPELNLLGFSTFGEIREFRAGQPGTYYQGCSRAIMEIKECSLQEAQDMITEFENQDMTIKKFYRVLQEWLGERILVEKSPTYTFDPGILRRIEAYFDSPLYVHLLRHPYGMICSYEEAKLDLLSGREFSRRVSFTRRELAELTWIISQQNIMGFLEDIPEDRQTRIRFEALVKQPQETTAALCRFLGVEFIPGEMLEPYKEQKKRMTDGIYSGGMMVGDVKFHLHKQIDPGVADTWREHYKTDFIGDITRQLAGNFGYNPINDTT